MSHHPPPPPLDGGGGGGGTPSTPHPAAPALAIRITSLDFSTRPPAPGWDLAVSPLDGAPLA